MTAPADGWFDAEELAGLPDFWRVYDANYDAVNESTLTLAREDPQFGPIIRGLTPDQLTEQQRDSRARMQRAIAGDWTDYDANLQAQGVMYAKLGVSYTAWYRLVRAVARDLSPLLFRELGDEPERVTRAVLAMQSFFDRAMARIGEAYLDAKQEIIREQEEDLAITLNSIGDAVIATDAEGSVVRMNPVAEQLTGWQLGEARGRPLSEVFNIISEETHRPAENPAARVLREGTIVGLANHTALVARDGMERPIADSGAPIRGEDGVIRGVVLVFRDMTEPRAVETALARSEARFRRLTDAGVIGVLVADLVGNILEANDPFLAMVGYSREDLVAGRVRWADMTPPEWRHLDQNAIRELGENGVFRTFEKQYLRKDGTRVPILLGGAMLDDKQVIAFILDITEQKMLEELKARSQLLEVENRRIQEANRLKSDFLANMSHELRTPLNAIIGFAELLHDGEVRPDMPQHKEFLGDILASGLHLLQLINDVLDLSKVEAGKLEFHPEEVDLGQVFAEVVAILRTTAAEKQIRVEIDVASEVGRVVVDASRLKQVLYNYVSNALKFTAEGGRVWVRARAEDAGSFRVEVEDSGIGIAPTDIGRLFTEFQQLDSGAAKKHSGTGLGLALTKRLVEAQGGSVGVRSKLGEGSAFHAVLPRQAITGTAIPMPRALPGARPGGPSILVIEDNERDLSVILQALSDAGYAVESAATGSQAIAKCRERVFDAITLDLLLPDVSGLEVLRGIRETALNREVPVIVITVVTERGAVAGFAVHDMLAKPLDTGSLLQSLRRAGVTAERSGEVLVIDDDAGSRKLMMATLSQLGYRATSVDRAAEGLTIAAKSPPLAVVLDLMMPEMDGFEFLERFRSLPECRLVPVVVWTVKDVSMDEHARLKESAHAVLQKGHGVGADVLEELKAFLPLPAAGFEGET
jgi:PAS domain S-box-containing protein